ncbi:MAG: glycosyltransferase [Microbacteriaceae bacterium]|nr:glycosyltransferase [Microbacteriaceae bacterium]MDR9443568.1 glycosyltransferase [Microbacteriaceae bacterium]
MENKLRVLLACDTFGPDVNGAARFAERLAAGLARRGHDLHIVAPAVKGLSGTNKEIHDGAELTVHRFPSIQMRKELSVRMMKPFGLKGKLGRLLDELEPDAVHIQSHLMVGRLLVGESKKRGIMTIATNHTMPENLIRYSVRLPKFLERPIMKFGWWDTGRVLKKMDKVTTPTRRAADILERESGISDVLAISCGIDASRFINKTPTSNTEPRVLFVGRLDYEKRLDILLRAIQQISSEVDVQLDIVGNGGERDNLKILSKELQIEDRVNFLGFVTEEELPKTYERTTVFAMPSIAELQSIATMEAMASGRPVIAADAMALPHLVHSGDNGYLYQPEDATELAGRLREVLTADEQELERLSENSLHLIQAHDITNTLNIFENLYQGIGEFSPTTEDNLEGYSQPIGRLSESLRERVDSFRESASELRGRMDDIRYGLRERLSEAREDIKEQFDGVKEDFNKARERFSRSSDKDD